MSERTLNPPTEILVSRNREPIFRQFVDHMLNNMDSAPEEDLINSGAEISGISPVTATRYLKKMCSSMGKCVSRTNEFGITLIKYK